MIFISSLKHYGLPIVTIDNRDYAIGDIFLVNQAFKKYCEENLENLDNSIIEQYGYSLLAEYNNKEITLYYFKEKYPNLLNNNDIEKIKTEIGINTICLDDIFMYRL